MSRQRLPLEGKLSPQATDEVEAPPSEAADLEPQLALPLGELAKPSGFD